MRSLERVNQTVLLAGAQLLLHRGDVWQDQMLQLSVRGAAGKPVRLASYGANSAARPLIRRANKTTDIAMLLDDASFVEIEGLAFQTAKVGLYFRYWDSYGHQSVSVTNCSFADMDDPEFDPYTMAKRGIFPSRDISWSSGIMVGGHLRSLDEPGTVLTGFNVTHCQFRSVAVGVEVAVGDWSSDSQPGNPLPFGRVEDVFLSDLTQSGALQGIVGLNYVIGARMTRLNSYSGGGERVHLPAGTSGGFLWSCQNVIIENSRFGHERRIEPTPDGEGIDFEGMNDNVLFRNNVIDYNYGPGILVMDHGPGSNNSNFWIEDTTFVGNGQDPQVR